MKWVTDGSLKKYMEKFVLLTPGDYPTQYYIRCVAYIHIYQGKPNNHTSNSDTSPGTSSNIDQSGPSNSVSPNSLTNIMTMSLSLCLY